MTSSMIVENCVEGHVIALQKPLAHRPPRVAHLIAVLANIVATGISLCLNVTNEQLLSCGGQIRHRLDLVYIGASLIFTPGQDGPMPTEVFTHFHLVGCKLGLTFVRYARRASK